MYLLTDSGRAERDGKICGSRSGRTDQAQRGTCVLTESQILSGPALPGSVVFFFFFFFSMERKLIHGSICLVSRAPFSAAVRDFSALSLGAYRPHTQLFSYGFPTKLREGTYGSYDNTSYQFSLRCRVKLRLRRRVSLISTQNHEIFTIYFSNNGKIKIMLGKCLATSLYLKLFFLCLALVYYNSTSDTGYYFGGGDSKPKLILSSCSNDLIWTSLGTFSGVLYTSIDYRRGQRATFSRTGNSFDTYKCVSTLTPH